MEEKRHPFSVSAKLRNTILLQNEAFVPCFDNVRNIISTKLANISVSWPALPACL